MNTQTIPTKIAYFNYIMDGIELPEDVVNLCYHMGDCSDDIERCMELPEVKAELAKLDPATLVKELSEYGAWNADQLADHTENLKRILWIAAGNIQDEDTSEDGDDGFMGDE